jgi:hypothetical protein
MVGTTSEKSEENQVHKEPGDHWMFGREETAIDPYSLFVLAIRSPVTRTKYIQRMGYFLDFLEIPKSDDYGSVISFENRINSFAQRAASSRKSYLQDKSDHKTRLGD